MADKNFDLDHIDVKCEMEDATTHCDTCEDFFCSDCTKIHAKFKVTRDHIVTAVNPSDPALPVTPPPPSPTTTPTSSSKIYKEIARKEGKSKVKKSSANATCEDVNGEEYLGKISTFLAATNLGLVPQPVTLGDGNCWYRAAAHQVTWHFSL